MDTSKVSFRRKILAYLGMKKSKDDLIVCSFLATFLLHSINIVFILGGWVFVAYYFDLIFNFKVGYISTLLAVILWVVFNFFYIYIMPCKFKEAKSITKPSGNMSQ